MENMATPPTSRQVCGPFSYARQPCKFLAAGAAESQDGLSQARLVLLIVEQYYTVWQLLYFPSIHLPYIPGEFRRT
jgi:hypothetical protein